MSEITEKICRKCGRLKPVNAFYENKYSPDGRYAFCKICFEQFAKRLKDGQPPPELRPAKKAEASAEEPEKKFDKTPDADWIPAQECEKCGKKRPVKMFETFADTPDFQKNWCTFCRRQHAGLKRKPPENKQTPRSAEESQTKPEHRRDPAPKIKETPTAPPALPLPAGADRNNAEDFDYIEYLLENEALKRKLSHDILKIPRQITKIKARTRVCNGCGKTEEIDQVEKNTVIPVHAWFCDVCRQRSAARWVRKGTIVCDYWGREFKVKKVISRELVLGKPKDKNEKNRSKTLKIYGNWKTGKAHAG
jgi:hypothetical protein